MPLINSFRFVAPGGGLVTGTGTQTVTGQLTLNDPTIVEVDPTVFTAPATYTVFIYGSLNPVNAVALGYLHAAGPGQDIDDLTGTGFTTATFFDTGSAITLTLG